MTASRRHALVLGLALLVGPPAVLATDLPDPYPRDGAVKVLDNDRLVVWNTIWQVGVPTPVHEHRMDQLSVTVEPGSVKVVNPDGTSTVGEAVAGTVRFLRAGTVHQEEGTSAPPRRAFMLEFKPGTRSEALGDVTGLFATGKATRVLDNDRAQVWDVALAKGATWNATMACCDVLSVILEPQGAAPAAGRLTYTRAGGPLSLSTDQGPVRVVFVVLK